MSAKSKPIAIWGGGGHGHVVIDILRTLGGWNPVGFIDNAHPVGARIMDVPVLGDMDVLPALLRQGVQDIVVAIGNCSVRAQMIKQALSLGFQTPSIAHPSCIVYPSASIGPACVICALSIVGAQTCVGAGVILNTRSVVDHDNHIGNCSHVAPGAVLCGFVTVGAETWIGAGSVVRDHISIGNHVMVGAGSVVVKNIPSDQMAYGNPAKLKARK